MMRSEPIAYPSDFQLNPIASSHEASRQKVSQIWPLQFFNRFFVITIRPFIKPY